MKQHKINVLQSLLDELATVGYFSNTYDKMSAIVLLNTIVLTYPYGSRNLKGTIADSYVHIASYFIDIAILKPTNLSTYLQNITNALENALTQLVD